jgi:hypothetical protein
MATPYLPDYPTEAQHKGYDEVPKCRELFKGEIPARNQTYQAEIDNEQQYKCEGAALEWFDECHSNLMLAGCG